MVKVLHSLMSQKYRTNFKASIQIDSREFTTSKEVVGDEFVRFYQNLLHTSKEFDSIPGDVVLRGPCLDDSSHDMLLALVTMRLSGLYCFLLVMIGLLVLMDFHLCSLKKLFFF